MTIDELIGKLHAIRRIHGSEIEVKSLNIDGEFASIGDISIRQEWVGAGCPLQDFVALTQHGD